MKIKKYALLMGSILMSHALCLSYSMLDNRCQGNTVSLSEMYARLNGDFVEKSSNVIENGNVTSSFVTDKDVKNSSIQIKSKVDESLPQASILKTKQLSDKLPGNHSAQLKSVKITGVRSALGITPVLGLTGLYYYFQKDSSLNLAEKSGDVVNEQLMNNNMTTQKSSLKLESIFKNKYYAATGIGLAAALGYGMYSWYYKNTNNN